jgi:protoporphyrinogen/coproporphyrinogen III oxidase
MVKNKKIAIIGAGISGLSSAYWLNKQGAQVTVYEKNTRPGGSIITEKTDGYLVDLGPNSTLETSEVLSALINEIGLKNEKIYANEVASNRYVLKNNTLHAIPMSAQLFLKTKLFSATAKLRLLKEPFIKPTDGQDISLADFVRYRLGNEFLDYAINPFVAGVYAGDPKTLSTEAAFPKLYSLEQKYGSFIKGAIKGARERKKRKEVAKDRAKLFSFKNGMQCFTDRLSELLKDKVQTNSTISSLKKTGNGYTLLVEKEGEKEKVSFDRIVLCTPAWALKDLLEELAPEQAAKLQHIRYPAVNVVFTGFHKKDIKRKLDGFGFLVPEVEQKKILGSIWSSTIFLGRAPKDYVAFTTFVGGTRNPEIAGLDDAALLKLVQEDINTIVGLRGQPSFTRIKRWEKAIPQYTMGYQKYQKMFSLLEEQIPGLYFAGNFRRGISVGDSVLCAHETVEKMNESIE